MFPVVIRLLLANFQDRLSYVIGFICFLEEESDGRRVYARIGIRRCHLERAIIVVEGLPQIMFVLRVRAPAILVGASENAQSFAVRRILRDQRLENILGATR